MRTKHILTALALPALLAACTADDFESVSTGTQAQRAQLNPNLEFSFGDAETRFSAGEPGAALTFSYEVNDTVGGAIIDEYLGGGSDIDNFIVKPYISTNHPFVYTGTKWELKHTMVEGHYMFYFPYNENNHERGAVRYSIPVLQDLSDAATGEFNPKAAIEKYNMSVSAKFLAKTDLSVSTQMTNLFSYPRLKVLIDNHYAGGEIDKIVLQAGASESFALNGQIDNDKLWNLYKDYEDEIDNYNTTDAFRLTSGSYYEQDLNETSDIMVLKAPAGTKTTTDAQNNKSFETYFVMPAATFSNPITVYVYMASGEVYRGTIAARAFNRNKIAALEVNAEAAPNAPYVVTSEADWNNYVSLLKKGDNVNFTVAGDNFSLSNSAKYPTVAATINVTGNLKVSGNNVTMKNVSAETITVLEGAKLTTDETLAADEIVNKGTLVLAKVVDEDGDAVTYSGVESVVNEGTVTVPAEAIAAFALTNEAGAKVVNNGTMSISGSNDATIENSGVMNISDDFENKANSDKNYDGEDDNFPTINNSGSILALNGTLTNAGTINNAKGATVTCKSLGGTIENGGVINATAGSTTYITDNNGGKVVVELAIPNDEVVITNANGRVEYTATKASESFKNSIVTDVIAKSTLTITDLGSVSTLTVNNTATLTLPKDAEIAAVNVKAGTTTLASDLSTDLLTVAKGAVVKVNSGTTLNVENMVNAGKISVAGQFVANMSGTEDSETSKAGLVEESGSNTNQVTWSLSDATTAKAKYEDALEVAVSEWANDGRPNISLGVGKLAYDIINGKNGKTTAADQFLAYYDANVVSGSQAAESVKEAMAALKEALTGYQKFNAGATITTGYAAAAKAVVANAEKAVTTLTLAWTVEQNENRIYKDDEDMTVKGAKSAATYALEAFKTAVAGGKVKKTVSGNETALETIEKVALCSSTTNHAPEYSQVFVTDVIYKIFGPDAIGAASDWSSINFNTPQNWTITEVNKWIEAIKTVKAADATMLVQNAQQFLKDNGLATSAPTWKYEAEIVAAIAEERLE